METPTQNTPKHPELLLPLGTTALLPQGDSEQILRYRKPNASDPQPAWALSSLFFIVDLA
jgi:hypothetical protein